MVKTVPRYNPPTELNREQRSASIRFDIRVMTRTGEVLIDFGEFGDLISYNDALSVESPAGSFNLKMRATLANEALLKKLHPGMLIEVYCARNADPLTNVEAFVPSLGTPRVFQIQEDGSGLADEFKPVEGAVQPPPEPEEADYLDNAPYLLMRGVTTAYGRSTTVASGSGAETLLTLSGESYGKVYRDAQILVDEKAPTALGKALEVRNSTQAPWTVVPLYYGILRHWIEDFWEEPTGWEARTRPIPVPPDIMARISEGSAWSALKYLSVQGLFHMFVDHTGAICWEKLPYSAKCDALIDEPLKALGSGELRNWEDLPLIEVPSWMITTWADRISADRLANYIRVKLNEYGGAAVGGSTLHAGQVHNMGSIRQYGGPRKMEILYPASRGTIPLEQVTGLTDRDVRMRSFMDRCALEVVRWYDRPVQRCILGLRGDAVWRINTKISLKEDWASRDARPGEYYIISRAHNINLKSGQWTTQLECLRDRRTRYLGIGLKPVEPDEMGTAADGLELPTESDEYWWFDVNAQGGSNIVKIEDWQALVGPLRPVCEVMETA
ncbi:hypothetical protein QGP82_23765 [Leptothoe sp. LEGE 181152]|nr:hypothetical protein [Leptothoe sp. LEGE 181152]